MSIQPTNIYRGAAIIRAGAGHPRRDWFRAMLDAPRVLHDPVLMAVPFDPSF